MTADMAIELADTAVEVVSLWPGLVHTELLDLGATREGDEVFIELPGEGRFDLSGAETPRFLGRAVCALWNDPGLPARSGRPFSSSALARELGFTDLDGTIHEVLLRPDA